MSTVNPLARLFVLEKLIQLQNTSGRNGPCMARIATLVGAPWAAEAFDVAPSPLDAPVTVKIDASEAEVDRLEKLAKAAKPKRGAKVAK